MVDIVTRAGKGSPLTNNEVDANFTNLAEVAGVTGEPMGHEDRTTSTISFNASTRTFTIAPVSTSFTVWCKGKKVVVSSAQTVTIPNTTGMYSIYYDANGVLAAKAGYFTFSVEAPTAYVYWNAATGTCPYFGDERHGVVLDWQTHEYLHRTRGAALASGFGASGYTLGGNGSSNAHAQLTLEGGTFFDEDMKIIVTATNTPTAGTWEQDLLSPARIPVLYLSGTGWVIDAPTDYPLKQGTARPQYNALSGGVWSTADVANNKYATSWILATNNLTYPVIAIIGQAESDLQSAAEAVDFTSLQLPGFPSVEFRPLYRLVFQCADSFSNAVKASLVSITDIRSIAAAGVAASLITDHGNLSGLSDDDHPQYLSVDTVRSTLTAAVKASFLPSQTGNAGKFLTTDATSTSWTALTSGNITTALGFTPYNATNPAGYITGITSSDVTTALGFTPYNATNPSGYITTAGARGAISVTGAGSYDSATGVINIVGGVTSFNTRTGAITLSSADVTTALGFTPYNSTNPNGYLTGITSTQVTTALGYTPYNSSNPSGYISGITSGMVTTALGYTPYNNSNPSGYITSSALSGYLTSASAASTYLPLSGGSLSGPLTITGNGTYVGNYGYSTLILQDSSGYPGLNYRSGSSNWLVRMNAGGGSMLWAYSSNASAQASGTYTQYLFLDTAELNHASSIRAPIFYDSNDTSRYIDPASDSKFQSGIFMGYGSASSGLRVDWPSAGNIGIFGTANQLNFASTGGVYLSVYSNGDFRAPIFYDSNDTGFYVDPNSTSRLNGVSVYTGVQGFVNAARGSNFGYSSSYGTIIYGVTSGSVTPCINVDPVGNSSGAFNGNGGEVMFRNGVTFITPTAANTSYHANILQLSEGNVYFGNVAQASGSLRAPIFYDSNDTGYYLDPNSTTSLRTVGSWRSDSSSWDGEFAGKIQYHAGAWYLQYTNEFNFRNSSGSNVFYGDGSGNTWATASSRAPVFYDSNNTGYFVDPAASTSGSFAGFVGIGGNYGSDDAGWGARLNVGGTPHARMDVRAAGDGIITTVYSHNGQNRGYMGTMSNHRLALGVNGSEIQTVYSSYSETVGSYRAPIFYDSNDTTYYTNPADTSTSAVFAGNISLNGVLVRRSAGTGYLSGNYASSETTATSGAIYTIGGSYYPTSTGLNNMYGIGYTYASVAGGAAGYTSGSAWGLYVATNGATRVFLDSDNGRVLATGDMRAPIYYDSDNTGTYINPNGGSIISAGGNYPLDIRSSQRYIARFWNQSAAGAGWWLANDSSTLVFHADSSGDKASLNTDGVFIATGSSRAPIFYDSNDTGYYVDPASNSLFNIIGFPGSASIRRTTGSNSPALGLPFSDTASTNSTLWIEVADGDTGGLAVTNEGVTVYGAGDNGSVFRVIDEDQYQSNGNNVTNATQFYVGQDSGAAWFRNQLHSKTDMRAPIFYDYNDTNYYCDPNSSSVLRNITAYGPIKQNSGGYATNGYGSSSGNEAVRAIPGGAAASFDGGQTGAIKIRLPQRANNTMWRMTIKIYNYDNSSISEYNVGSYSYSTGAYNWGASVNCSGNAAPRNVRVGNDGSYDCVWIGETDTGWSYPIIAVTDFIGGFRNGNAENWVGNWDVSIVSSFTGTQSVVSPSNRVYSLVVDNSTYSPTYYDNNDTAYYVNANGSSYLYGIVLSGAMYFRPSNWIQMDGSYGIYWPNHYGAHFNPNTSSTYTQLMTQGNKNGYGGMYDSYSAVNGMMYDSAGNGGAYREATGRWYWYHHVGNNCMGIGTASTSSTWSIYADKGAYFGSRTDATIYYDANDSTYYADLNSTGTSIRAAGNITAYYSDMRLKTHLGKIENARDKVRQLEGFYYEANELAQSFGYKAKREVGVSAQAVQAVLPEIVTDAPINSNYLTIDYERLTPLLIEAIKEQDTELVDLRNRVAQLESLINKLIGD